MGQWHAESDGPSPMVKSDLVTLKGCNDTSFIFASYDSTIKGTDDQWLIICRLLKWTIDQTKTQLFSVVSGEKLGFQITLLLASYIYFDVFQDLLPPFEKTINTPAALIFFVILIIIQFFTIIGNDFINYDSKIRDRIKKFRFLNFILKGLFMDQIFIRSFIDAAASIVHERWILCSDRFLDRLKVCLWEQRLETNGWEKPWFQSFVNRVTQSNIKEADFKHDDGELDVEEFEKEQRECFFDRIDWLCFIMAFVTLLIAAGASIIDAARKR